MSLNQCHADCYILGIYIYVYKVCGQIGRRLLHFGQSCTAKSRFKVCSKEVCHSLRYLALDTSDWAVPTGERAHFGDEDIQGNCNRGGKGSLLELRTFGLLPRDTRGGPIGWHTQYLTSRVKNTFISLWYRLPAIPLTFKNSKTSNIVVNCHNTIFNVGSSQNLVTATVAFTTNDV